jgi:hypothetical protein
MDNRKAPVGPGALSMDELDVFVILMLYHEEPSRRLANYVKCLYYYTGTIVSRSTISRLFKNGFDIKGSLCKPDLIPRDKFRPANIYKAVEYLIILSQFARVRIKFGDEKHLKGSEMYCRHTRRNVLTGEIPPVMTESDFRNTYSVFGICGIDTRVSPVRYGIVQGTNDAENFAVQIENALLAGFLLPFDVLVLDNAAIHTGKENFVLEDWLWSNFRILVILLPARSPEWNPIELLWNSLAGRLNSFDLILIPFLGPHPLVGAAEIILNQVTHDEIDRYYKKCNV